MNESLVEFLLRTSYVFFAIAVAGILLFSLIQLFQNIRSSLPTLFGIAGVGLVFLVAFLNTSQESAVGDFSPELINMASAGIAAIYILGGLAIIGIIFGEIWTSIK